MVTTHFLPSANFLAIVVAGAAYFAFGYIWFSLLFNKARTAELEKAGIKISMPAGNQMLSKMALSFIGNVIGATAIAYVFHHFGVVTLDRALKVGIIIGIGFVASTLAIIYPWEGKSMKLYIIDTGHYLLGLLICSFILAVWR